MKYAFLFPGQGAQAVGMGVDIASAFPEVKARFETASNIAGFDVLALCTDGPIEQLSQTKYTQPAVFTVEAILAELLAEKGVTASCLAGHSLGEFAAWYAAGVFSFEDGVKLVSERGRIMDGVDPDGIGTMAAIIGLDQTAVQDACKKAEGTVVVANINSPLQLVISGEKDAVAAAGALLKEAGAKRVLPLKVSGAFHSPLMEGARDEFAAVVDSITLNNAATPVFSNVTADAVTDSAEIKELMVRQMTSSVRWTESVTAMREAGIESALEIGPGAVLAGLIRRIDKEFPVQSVSGLESITEVANG